MGEWKHSNTPRLLLLWMSYFEENPFMFRSSIFFASNNILTMQRLECGPHPKVSDGRGTACQAAHPYR